MCVLYYYYLVLLLLLYQNRKKVSKRGRKESRGARSSQQQTHGKKALLPSSSFGLLFFLCTPFVRENQPLLARPLSSFSSSSSWDDRLLLCFFARLQTHSFLSCFSVLFSSFLWISTHFDCCCTESVCWLGTEHARTDRLLMIDFFLLLKKKERRKRNCCRSTALPIIFLLYLADRFNPIKWPLTFSLAFSSFACSLLRGFYLLLVLHSFKKVCTPFSFTCTVVFSGTFGHARTLKRGKNGSSSSSSSSSSRTVQLITLDRQINGQRIEFALWSSSFFATSKMRARTKKDLPVSKW